MKVIDDSEKLNRYIKTYNLKDILPKELINSIELCQYHEDESILVANEEMHYFYFFIKGKLKIYQLHENGRSLLIQFYSDFDSLGEVELMNEWGASCSVKAIQKSDLIRIPIDAMRKFAVDYPPFLKYIIKSISIKLIDADQHHSYNLLYPVKNRLASYLVAHASESNDIRLSESFQEIAEYIGTTYRQLHRAFQQLVKDQFIVKDSKSIKIVNIEELSKLAGKIYQSI